jgi:hypothetical protein
MRALTRIKILFLISAFATPVSAQTYEPALIPPQINGAPTIMTPLNLGDDNTRNVALGFEFNYWGQTFTDAWVSSNGFVSFQSGAHLCCNGQPIEMAQRNTIYAYWSDLISFTGNPYYRRDNGSILFGWYGVNEYGTNNSSTFEIGLFADGKIQLNYGNLGFSGRRDFTAGITGPTADDNISLFYGRNAQFLQNQSGILSWIAPAATVDCNVTPMDPTCPPAVVDVIPDPVAAIAEAVEQSAVIEPEAMDQVQQVAEAALERAEEVEAVAETVAPAEEPEAAAESAGAEAEVSADETDTAERLSPDEVAALAATGPDPEGNMQQQDGLAQEAQQVQANAQAQSSFMQETQDASVSGAFTTQMRFDTTFGGAISFGPTISVAQSASPLDMATSPSSPLSMANAVEILGIGSPPPAASTASAQQSEGGMSEGQGEKISEMGAVPGFAAYTQASLQDRADFYAVRDIYRNRRLRDANFELYRLMQTNDARWQEMVDEQYR